MPSEHEHSLIVLEQVKSPASESFRTLRTNLQFSKVNGGLHSLIITSPGPQEGKSTVTANMGVVIARAGKKVIIVDCDLRKPVQHNIFGKQNMGLVNYLIEEATIEELIQSTEIENLSLLTSGSVLPNPSEMLGSARMMELLIYLKSHYNFIILDVPPVIVVSDASVLASQVDGIALVVRAGLSRPEMVLRAKELLLQAGGNILGVILNQVEVTKGYSSYYYYNY